MLFAAAFAGVIHDYEEHHPSEHHHEPEEHHETDHNHKVEHEHATSHQSFKIHHFHAVPVYVKKEDQHFLKHPIEVSGVKHKLKVCNNYYLPLLPFNKYKLFQILHPETEKHHNHGLVLENHTDEHSNVHHDHHEYEPSHHESLHEESHHDIGGGDHHGFGGGDESSHHQFHDINVHHGHHHE